jgi:type I restriction enzyme R subunit
MNEEEIRAEHIDAAFAAAGRGALEGSRIRREYPITPGFPKRLNPGETRK